MLQALFLVPDSPGGSRKNAVGTLFLLNEAAIIGGVQFEEFRFRSSISRRNDDGVAISAG